MKKDIEGRDIEPGDLLLRSILSNLTKCYALYYTKGSDKLVISCSKGAYGVQRYAALEDHDDKQYPFYDWGDFYILEKNAKVPEKLQRFIRK